MFANGKIELLLTRLSGETNTEICPEITITITINSEHTAFCCAFITCTRFERVHTALSTRLS